MDKTRAEFYELMKEEISPENREIWNNLVESLQIPQESIDIDEDYYDWNRNNGFTFIMVGPNESLKFNIRYFNSEEVCFYITYYVKKHAEKTRLAIYDTPQWEMTKASYDKKLYRFNWYTNADENYAPALRYKEIAESILQAI